MISIRFAQWCHDYADQYRAAKPFPCGVFDGLLRPAALARLLRGLPAADDPRLIRYVSPLECKQMLECTDLMSPAVLAVLAELNSSAFVGCLETLTGIDGLIPDPHFRGGGVGLAKRGGKLDVHADFNLHPKLRLIRRLNAILFLNPGWRAEWGGDLELWSGNAETLDHCEAKIAPLANRLCVFDVGELSYHGFPQPITCPLDVCRWSLAVYYYVSPAVELRGHSTRFMGRPGENDGLDQLRSERREKGAVKA